MGKDHREGKLRGKESSLTPQPSTDTLEPHLVGNDSPLPTDHPPGELSLHVQLWVLQNNKSPHSPHTHKTTQHMYRYCINIIMYNRLKSTQHIR